MTIFFALNERFKASPQRQSLSIFEDKLYSFLSSTQKQSCIEGEFEVKNTHKKTFTLIYIIMLYFNKSRQSCPNHIKQTSVHLFLRNCCLFDQNTQLTTI